MKRFPVERETLREKANGSTNPQIRSPSFSMRTALGRQGITEPVHYTKRRQSRELSFHSRYTGKSISCFGPSRSGCLIRRRAVPCPPARVALPPLLRKLQSGGIRWVFKPSGSCLCTAQPLLFGRRSLRHIRSEFPGMYPPQKMS